MRPTLQQTVNKDSKKKVSLGKGTSRLPGEMQAFTGMSVQVWYIHTVQ